MSLQNKCFAEHVEPPDCTGGFVVRVVFALDFLTGIKKEEINYKVW